MHARRPPSQILLEFGFRCPPRLGAIVRHGVLDPDSLFIQKPFSPSALGHKVRAAIDASPRTGGRPTPPASP